MLKWCEHDKVLPDTGARRTRCTRRPVIALTVVPPCNLATLQRGEPGARAARAGRHQHYGRRLRQILLGAGIRAHRVRRLGSPIVCRVSPHVPFTGYAASGPP